jgi:hypothetical protein
MRRQIQEKNELSSLLSWTFGDVGCGSGSVTFQVSDFKQFIKLTQVFSHFLDAVSGHAAVHCTRAPG